jgi:hypothetical protein
MLKESLGCDNTRNTMNMDYDTAIGLNAIAYNLLVLSNRELGGKPREIMKILIC